MEITKAHWTTDGDTVRMTMPLQKVDEEKRIVSGWATMDNEDLHGDIVTAEASTKAFERFRGNIRLMHQPVPAGKLVNFREKEFYDEKTEKFYRGIYVDAYISKGAPQVWEMVLDGTLTGFSIGGNVISTEPGFDKAAGRQVRFVKDYEMVELSLVDNPANQLSNIFSIQKTADGQKVEGMITKVNTEVVLYCKDDQIANSGDVTEKDCDVCHKPMKNIGWFESDGGDRTEKVNSLIQKFNSNEGGEENMPEEKNEEVKSAEEVSPKGDDEVVAPEGEEAATATEVEVGDETVTITGTGEEKVEEAKELPEPADGEVVENPLEAKNDDESSEIRKLFAEFNTSISSALEKNAAQTTQALTDVNAKLGAVTEDLEKQLNALSKSHSELSEKFGSLNSQVESVEKRFGGIEKSMAVKKSSDLGGSEEDSSIKKSNESKWGGRFFGTSQLG